MRGRKPKPTVLKILEGNRGKDKHPVNTREPLPDPIPTDCPPELTAPEAVEEWTRTIIPAIHRRQITSAERVFAIAHCALWATWRSQLADAEKHAHVVAVNGKPTPNPARGMANKTLLLLVKVDSELGLTPVSRSRGIGDRETYGKTQSKWAGVL